jgi:hypothetical protein
MHSLVVYLWVLRYSIYYLKYNLFNKSNEEIEKYFNENSIDSIWAKLPLNFFIAFVSYSLILLVEKVAFDSHSLTEGQHHHDHDDHEKYEPFLAKDNKVSIEDEYDELKNKDIHINNNKHDYKILNALEHTTEETNIRQRNLTYNNDGVNILLSPVTNVNNILEEPKESSDHDSDIDEETLKNVLSTKGKFASYLQNRNLCKTIFHHSTYSI